MHRLTTLFFFLFVSLVLSLTPMADTLDVCLVSGSWEYDSQQCLTLFETYVESNYDADCTLLQATERDNLPGLDALDTCDVALFFTRRLKIEGEQLALVKNYIESGKPVVAVRTASHGFQNWLECDKLVYGGNYHGHYGNKWTQTVKIMADSHPVLAGVREFQSPYSLYKTKPLADDTRVLLLSTIPNQDPEPSAWTREYKGARIFYTSLGGVSDFENASFRRMMANALFWTARRDIPQPPKPKVSPLKRDNQQANLLFRTRVKGFKGLDRWEEVYFDKKWNTRETAVIICDMWDHHWCEGAEKRCEAIAQKMNPVVNACRDAGMLIVHAPSSTLGFYANTEPRERARQAPKTEPPQEQQITAPPLPIDDSDGGCDSGQTV
ncbi:hypothetical protein GF373_14845, partial [bacterium]|nr:hypothetical protein [bacterium]